MKLSLVAFLASITSTAAFVPLSSTKTASTSKISQTDEEEIVEEIRSGEPTEQEPVVSPGMSQALPWMERPAALDGSLPGDAGFDPLGFAKTKEDLYNYRDAEVSAATRRLTRGRCIRYPCLIL